MNRIVRVDIGETCDVSGDFAGLTGRHYPALTHIAIPAGELLQGCSQTGRQDKSPIAKSLPDRTGLFPAAGADVQMGSEEGEAARLFQSLAEVQVFHQRETREAPQFIEDRSTHKDPLIPVDPTRPVNSYGIPPFQPAIDPTGVIENLPKASSDNFGFVPQSRANLFEARTLQPAIGVQKQQDLARRRDSPRIHLNCPSLPGFQNSIGCRSKFQSAIRTAAVCDDDLDISQLSGSIDAISDPGLFIEYRNDDGDGVSWSVGGHRQSGPPGTGVELRKGRLNGRNGG